ncbi:MAG: ABC transporter ATP-binding protein/permease [Candidatus Lokiarchaeota archaeon]|nr:ABC transporter ATP-binding protein/permease [Candidatus Harpocratesius repetitus]
MKGSKWVAKLAFQYPITTIYVIIVSIIEVLLFIFPISITAQLIEALLNGATMKDVQSDLFFLFGLALFQALIFFSISFLNEVIAHRVTTDMTQELFESLQYRSLTYHDGKDVGEIMARATGDTRTVNIAISPAVRIFLEILTLWSVIFILTALVHWVLLLWAIIVFVLFTITTFFYAKKLVPYTVNLREKFGELSETTNTYFTGIREIKSFVSQSWAKRKYGKKVMQYRSIELASGKRGAWFYPMLVVTFFSASIIVLTLFFAFKGIFGVTFSDVIKLSSMITLLTGMSEEMGWSTEFLIRGNTSANRIYNIIHENDPGSFSDGKEEFNSNQSDIEFRNVSFKYRSNLPWALRNVSFKVNKNQTIAIVGSPGSGKSTIAKLIQRLYLPNEGEILLGGRPIQEYSNKSLRKNIATVEQDIFLFNTTIKENIRFGKPSATDEEVIQAAKLAKAHNFIMELPQKYNNLIGEGGIRLSGGQAQRLSIARALLVNPSILLMDDGASALDAQTEIQIQNAISNILKTHTTIITTHRLSIISKVDLVIILERGEIVGLGTHEQLIRSNSFYRRLFERHYELPPIEEVLINTEVVGE